MLACHHTLHLNISKCIDILQFKVIKYTIMPLFFLLQIKVCNVMIPLYAGWFRL